MGHEKRMGSDWKYGAWVRHLIVCTDVGPEANRTFRRDSDLE